MSELIDAIPDTWERRGDAIYRIYRFDDFRTAFGFMERAARAIDRHDHHPDWRNRFGRVEIMLTTHEVGTVTDRDVRLARDLDRLADETKGPSEW